MNIKLFPYHLLKRLTNFLFNWFGTVLKNWPYFLFHGSTYLYINITVFIIVAIVSFRNQMVLSPLYSSILSEVKATQSCLTLCNPMDCTVRGILQARILEWVVFSSPGDLPNPGIEPRSATLQADPLPAEPQGKPRILEWVAYPFSSGSSWPRNQTGVSCIAGGFFTNWAIREAHMVMGLI